MMYDVCSYNIPKDDLNMMKTLASEFGFTISKMSNEEQTNEIEELSWNRVTYHTVEFEPIEVESFSEGLSIDDRFWEMLKDRSSNREIIDICNS